MRPPTVRRLLPLVILAALTLGSACGDELGVSKPAKDEASESLARRAEAPPAPVAPARAAPDAAAGNGFVASQSVPTGKVAEFAATSDGQSLGAVQLPSADSAAARGMVIRNGVAALQVDSLDAAIARVRALAATLGGFVSNTQIFAGENQVRSATIEIKLPVARFEQGTGALAPIGKLESLNISTEDVGEEYVDISARMANAHRLEERLVTLLATRTGKLQDVLSVERELARVRGEIERYEGRLRFLRSRVALSTLTVNVHEKAPLVSPTPGDNVMTQAFRNAWRNFVFFLASLIQALGWLIPATVLTTVAVILVRRYLPRAARALPKAEVT
jgi:hypothetical protein